MGRQVGKGLWRAYQKKSIIIAAKRLEEDLEVGTLEGVMLGRKGDYLIRGVAGEFYPCKAEVFEQTYEEVR